MAGALIVAAAIRVITAGPPEKARLATGEGVMIPVTSQPPEYFLRIVTPSGLEFGWPVTKGSIGYKVAEEIVALAEPAPRGVKACKKG